METLSSGFSGLIVFSDSLPTDPGGSGHLFSDVLGSYAPQPFPSRAE
jgi:hypothetical protein